MAKRPSRRTINATMKKVDAYLSASARIDNVFKPSITFREALILRIPDMRYGLQFNGTNHIAKALMQTGRVTPQQIEAMLALFS